MGNKIEILSCPAEEDRYIAGQGITPAISHEKASAAGKREASDRSIV